jgi:hypothetical protein
MWRYTLPQTGGLYYHHIMIDIWRSSALAGVVIVAPRLIKYAPRVTLQIVVSLLRL